MKRFTLALIATCIASTMAVAAPDDAQASDQHKRRDPAKMFSRADQNSDGKISLEEFLAQRGRRGNQETATAEQKAKMDERRTAMFKRLDANSDGFVTTEEFQAFAAKHGRREHKPADQQQQQQ